MPKLLCVYCSSSTKIDPKYYAEGERLGRAMVAHGWGLVYGGGNVGLMGVVARSVKEAGGTVVGVIPDFMQVRELAYVEATELVVVPTMRERKRLMAERADAFLTLPGGIGTLEEMTEIMSERYLNLTQKPLILLNQDGFYDDLLRFFERMVAEKFKSAGLAELLAVAPTVDDVWPLLDQPKAFESDPIWR
ncbi:TIGR00730 family Rossman fold protein [Rariglobus hedericola]|uniref:Cytokinin riboside 5'-monophosphate phosphoribohydrolase n=1 Tax=Rariglobus hedericola TaxID=2597822 RepID=A0A556QMC8_9BACT|nr:TIGR00730 family Rossman fold protein [Rariglobus hedericola]TSJ77810.1 TIGR00730 family Rossman fold protein [Rariglobus hedericola]